MTDQYLKDRYIGLGDLVISKDPSINRMQILNLVDFYVVRRPRAGGPVGSEPQSIDLSEYRWSRKTASQVIVTELFVEGVEFVPSIKDFSANARSKEFYSDKRIATKKMSAIFQQNGRVETRRGLERFTETECEANCMLRHIRNSIAHGNMYKLTHQRILLLDKSGSRALTAYAITTPARLHKLMLKLESGLPS